MSRQAEPLRGQLEARKIEIPELRERKSSIRGHLGGKQRWFGSGSRLAVAVEQVFDKERRLLGRGGARFLRCLWHRGGCSVDQSCRRKKLTYTPSRLQRVSLFCIVVFFASSTFGENNDNKKVEPRFTSGATSSEVRKKTKSKSCALKRAGCESSDVSFRSVLRCAQKSPPEKRVCRVSQPRRLMQG